MSAALFERLAGGTTTVCRCWSLRRRDGRVFGFTDHDADLNFEGITFSAGNGLSARALMQSTGLSVDNAEALGVLSDAAITEADIEAGRFDGAEVRAWLVDWQEVGARALRFRGTIGELRRGAGAFHAELRGLAEALNQPQGRVYQRQCGAVLGDGSCRVDLGQETLSVERPVEEVARGQVFAFARMDDFEPRWFERGRLALLSGAAEGLSGLVKHDQVAEDGRRVIELWEPLRAPVVAGDLLRLEAGCDKRAETCRFKFSNFRNFRGFPFIPGEDWLLSLPQRSEGGA